MSEIKVCDKIERITKRITIDSEDKRVDGKIIDIGDIFIVEELDGYGWCKVSGLYDFYVCPEYFKKVEDNNMTKLTKEEALAKIEELRKFIEGEDEWAAEDIEPGTKLFSENTTSLTIVKTSKGEYSVMDNTHYIWTMTALTESKEKMMRHLNENGYTKTCNK